MYGTACGFRVGAFAGLGTASFSICSKDAGLLPGRRLGNAVACCGPEPAPSSQHLSDTMDWSFTEASVPCTAAEWPYKARTLTHR